MAREQSKAGGSAVPIKNLDPPPYLWRFRKKTKVSHEESEDHSRRGRLWDNIGRIGAGNSPPSESYLDDLIRKQPQDKYRTNSAARPAPSCLKPAAAENGKPGLGSCKPSGANWGRCRHWPRSPTGSLGRKCCYRPAQHRLCRPIIRRWARVKMGHADPRAQPPPSTYAAAG